MILRKKKTDASKASATVDFRHYDVIVNPVVTEKSTRHSEQNKVMFNVAPNANKDQIKSAVEALFGVKVTSVNTLNRKGKAKMFRGRPGVQQDKKKAIVTLENGQNIDFSTGVK
jgi:large subunit ribosomal protein L23